MYSNILIISQKLKSSKKKIVYYLSYLFYNNFVTLGKKIIKVLHACLGYKLMLYFWCAIELHVKKQTLKCHCL